MIYGTALVRMSFLSRFALSIKNVHLVYTTFWFTLVSIFYVSCCKAFPPQPVRGLAELQERLISQSSSLRHWGGLMGTSAFTS